MRSCIDAYNAHDAAAVAAMVTEEADIRDMAAGERFVGPAGVREFVEREWRDVASDARWELGQVLVDGEAFAAEWVTSGTKDRAGGGFPATGKPFEVHAVAVGRLREGKLAEARIYYDIAGLLVQWGLMPAPGAMAPTPS